MYFTSNGDGTVSILDVTVETELAVANTFEWAFIAGIILIFFFMVLAKMLHPVFLIVSGITLMFLSFSIQSVSENTALFVIALFGGIVLMVFGAIMSLIGDSR